MKARKYHPEALSPCRNPRGVALVIVLGFLVLITVLIVAYFSLVTTESSAMNSYANGAATNFLADSAVNVVMGQIAQATQGQGANSTTRLTWASQPGMIRTYDDTGAATNCYKLYSSGTMVIPSSTVQSSSNAVLTAMTADVPAGWNSEPAMYTDLNAPVTDSSGNLNFPILDGHLTTVTVGRSKFLTYDTGGEAADVAGWADIEGFDILPATVPNYSSVNPISATNNPAPMPVRWLYVLKDGTMISPDPVATGSPATSGSTATFLQAAAQPNAANPIVGRIAFWTDDETCKLNINTASEGTYYAMPHGGTPTDMQAVTTSITKPSFGFAVSPPATGEFNRYIGHPAATCLSVAMGTWMKSPLDQYTPSAYSSTSNDQSYLGDLADYQTMLPRSGSGGSLAGTVSVSSTNFAIVSTPTNRLYASFDELMFNPSRTPNIASAGPPQTSFTRAEIEELKFFLTANSRAPELTPFNTPKISLWPQWYSSTDRQKYQGPAQQLLAFCSSFGTATTGSSASGQNEYFFQWYSSTFPNGHGLGAAQLGYPPFAANSSSDSSLDWTAVPRNQQLATYLCNLGNHDIPGYGGAFRSTAKYSDRCFSNIVLECLDYIRSCVARVDYEYPASVTASGTTSGATSEGTQEYWLTAPLMVADSILPGVSSGNPIKGFGYFPIVPEVVLGEGLSVSGSTLSPTAFLAFNVFTAPWSFPAGQQNFSVAVTGLSNIGVTPNTGTPGFTQGATNFIGRRVNAFGGDGDYYGRVIPLRVDVDDIWGYSCPTSSGTTTVTLGGSGAVQILLTDGTGRAFQTMSVAFPPTQPLPLPTSGDDMGDWYGEVDPYSDGVDQRTSLFEAGRSAARGMECNAATAAAGDWRILGGTVNAASGTAPIGSGTTGNLFAPVGGTVGYTSTNAQVHSLRVWSNNFTQLVNGLVPAVSIAGTLAPSVSATGSPVLSSTDYGNCEAPFASQGLQGAVNIKGRPGDWDTGAGLFPDGPYINVADQVDTNDPYGNHGGLWGAYIPSAALPYGLSQYFSPNKRIASAIQFGSLPTGVSAAPSGSPQTTLNVTPRPWETLLFCPNPAARSMPIGTPLPLGGSEHIGFANPPDHLFLQFFTLPVVQPYAISEPLSTAGKVNLNYQLAPFSYIERSTALRGVLKNTLVAGISGHDVQAQTYKPLYLNNARASNSEIRYDINRDATIAGIEEHYFNQGQLFRYPSEICDVFLVPAHLGWPSDAGATYNSQAMPPPATSGTTLAYDQMLGWWNPTASTGDPLSTMCMTGDNLREEPYDHIYPRLTTQSNTFTVHCRVQVLQKRPNSNVAVWNEGQDVIAAEYRGSSIIERYIDPNDPALNPQWDTDTINLNINASAGGTADLSRLYKFRIISTKKFAP